MNSVSSFAWFGAAESRRRRMISRRIPDRLVASVARFARFNAVGLIGLTVDSVAFCAACGFGSNTATARGLSLVAATAVTWSLDRRYTFAPSRRRRLDESLRYLLVALLAQSQSYFVFLGLLDACPSTSPCLCLLAGAAWSTGVAFAGQSLFTFAPVGSLVEDRDRPSAIGQWLVIRRPSVPAAFGRSGTPRTAGPA